MKKISLFLLLCYGLFFGAAGTTPVIAGPHGSGDFINISEVEIVSVGDTEAVLSWETDIACVSQVAYGTTHKLDSEFELDSDNLVTSHLVTLTGLSPDTEYFFKIKTSAKKGRKQSELMSFRTQLASDLSAAGVEDPFGAFKISAPKAGSTVSGTVAVEFEGSKLRTLSRVEISVDGEPFETIDNPPFAFELDTTMFESGSRTVCADGYDSNGEKLSHCVSVLVGNGDRASASFRFVVIGDTRSGHSVHKNVVSEIVGLNPKPVMIFNTGDLTASGSTSEWNTWKDISAPLGINWNVDPPQYIGAYGNHDGASTAWKNYLVGQQRYGDGKSFFISYGNALFLVLNSISETKAAWVESTLKEQAPKHDWIFAFWHEPPYPFGSKSMDNSYKTFCPILQKYNAKVVFVGHAHYYTRSYPMIMDGTTKPKRDDEKGIVQIVAGGAGAPLYSISTSVTYKDLYAQGKATNHYCIVDITNNVMNMTVKNLSGQVIDTLRMELKSTGDTPPAVEITNPKNNQTVNGTLTLSANASDDKGVSKVEFLVDGQLVKSVSSTPYEASWNSQNVANGAHTVKAVAYDTANQSTSASVTITVSNSTPGNQVVASDGFEEYAWNGGKGWLGAWTKAGDVKKVNQTPYEGKKYARLRAGTGRLERSVNLSKVSSPVLKFAARVRSFEATDRAVVKVSNDGKTYAEALVLTSKESDNAYHVYTIDLTKYSPGSNFRILFSGEMSKATDYWYIDDISVSGTLSR